MSFPLSVIRQSAAEILACAVFELFPGVELIGSSVTEIGFHYDFQVEQAFDEQMLPLIEEKMRALIKDSRPIKELTMMRQNAIVFFTHHKQLVVAERLSHVLDNTVSIFQMGSFHDFCQAPFVVNSKDIGAIKLIGIVHTGKNLRIEGTALANSYDLKKFLKKIEGYKKRDHRVIGREIQFFEVLPQSKQLAWLPKGISVFNDLQTLWRKAMQVQQAVICPPRSLESSLALKKAGLFQIPHRKVPDWEIEGKHYFLSFPYSTQHAQLYLSKKRFHQEFPLVFANWRETYTNEDEDKLWGMLKSRSFTFDEVSNFCTPQQVMKEIISSLQFIKKTINIFGFEHRWYLRTQAKKSVGDLQQWQQSTQWMTQALAECAIEYTIDKEKLTYFGPYLEVRLIDALGREWKSAYLSIDLNQPKCLELSFVDALGNKQSPIMIKQSLLGSLERFVALLIEKYKGHLPFWLSPEQVKILPVGERFEYAEGIREKLTREGFRVEIDYRQEPLANKVHAAELERSPYIVIVGEKEEKNCSLSVRSIAQNQTNGGTKIEAFLELLKKESRQLGDRKSFES